MLTHISWTVKHAEWGKRVKYDEKKAIKAAEGK